MGGHDGPVLVLHQSLLISTPEILLRYVSRQVGLLSVTCRPMHAFNGKILRKTLQTLERPEYFSECAVAGGQPTQQVTFERNSNIPPVFSL